MHASVRTLELARNRRHSAESLKHKGYGKRESVLKVFSLLLQTLFCSRSFGGKEFVLLCGDNS